MCIGGNTTRPPTRGAGDMSKPRKTQDVYNVEGNYGYGHGFEIVTAATSWKEARSLIRDYRENEPGVAFRLRKTREKIS